MTEIEQAAELNNLAARTLADGDARKAVDIFQEASAYQPTNADIRYNTANAMMLCGNRDGCIAWATVAIELNHAHWRALSLRGTAYAGQAKFNEAEADLRKSLGYNPKQPIIIANLGMILGQRGDNCGSGQMYYRAIADGAATAQNYFGLGTALHRQALYEQAIESYQQAVALDPASTESWFNLSNSLFEIGRHDEAIGAIKRGLEISPQNAPLWCNLGMNYSAKGQHEEAIKAYKEAIKIAPEWADAQCNLANVYDACGDYNSAEFCYRFSISLRPNYPIAIHNLANTLAKTGRVEEAIRMIRMALTLDPDLAVAHWSLGLLLLMKGDYKNGWAEYDWRWRVPGLKIRTDFHKPKWNGEDISGKTILIHSEQGFGDTIMASRYILNITEKFPNHSSAVIFACQPELVELFKAQNWPGVLVCDHTKFVPAFDYHCPIMSLPRIFGCTPENIPRAEGWLTRYGHERLNHLTVGYADKGRPTHPRDKQRSIQGPELLNMLLNSGNNVTSLMVGDCFSKSGIDLSLKSFFDTSGRIECCDVVVTVDTAVAHLAGAMGKPCIVLLPYFPDFRWGLYGTHTPWYKSISLARQTKPGDWSVPLSLAAQWLDKMEKEC